MFYAKKEIRQERLKICKACEHYLPLLGNCGICGCFMRVKTAIASMRCADTNNRRWERVGVEQDTPRVSPQFTEEVLEIVDLLRIPNGWNKNDTKQRAITLHNTIFGTNYKVDTTCGSCTSTVYQNLKRLYNDFKKDIKE